MTAVVVWACSVSGNAIAKEGTRRISIAPGPGGQGSFPANGSSTKVYMTPDGRFVLFTSAATNLIDGDPGGGIFLSDTVTHQIERISNATSYLNQHISGDGRYVVYQGSGCGTNVFLKDRNTSTVERIDITDAAQGSWPLRTSPTSVPCTGVISSSPVVSDDGRYVAFISNAQNLIEGDTNASYDVFVRDRVLGNVERVSLTAIGGEANGHSGLGTAPLSGRIHMTPDGRYVTFESRATNIVPNDINNKVDIFVRDRLGPDTIRVSMSNSQTEGDGDSTFPTVSSDGRFFAFESNAKNFVLGDTNNSYDVFVRDELLDTTQRVSLSSLGTQATGASRNPWISADGQHVAFASTAANLVPYDSNSNQDIFVRDRGTGKTTMVSRTTFGGQPRGGNSSYPVISGIGRYVAFESLANNLATEPNDSNNASDIFVRDVLAMPERISTGSGGEQGADQANRPSITADGRYVAFHTRSALVPEDTNGVGDVYLKDRFTDRIERVSVADDESQANGNSIFAAVSQDARYVAFGSTATNLVFAPLDTNGAGDIYLRDRVLGTTELVSISNGGGSATGGDSRFAAISDDGRYVAFQSLANDLVPNDTNGNWDIFLRDRVLAITTRISVSSNGDQTTSGPSTRPTISALGGFVVFHSWSPNLVNSGDPGGADTNGRVDVFLRDVNNNITERISVDSNEVQANGESQFATVSSNGKYVAFHSTATNLVANDTNGYRDVFLRNRTNGTTTRVSVSSAGAQVSNASGFATVAQNDASGALIAFHSEASDLLNAGIDTNGVRDCYARWIPTTGSAVTWRVGTFRPGYEVDTGVQLNDFSGTCIPARDGSPVVFQSPATNVVAGDTNGVQDIFAVEA